MWSPESFDVYIRSSTCKDRMYVCSVKVLDANNG